MANKKEGTGKKVVGGIALGLVLILLGGVAGGLLQHHFNWGEDEPTVEEPEDPKDEGEGGSVVDEGDSQGMKLSVRKLMTSEYEEYGVSELAETAYTLTATVTPGDADSPVSWSAEFVDAGDEWATGKAVEDYIKLTPTSEGALTATVEVLDAFGAQISIKAKVSDFFATCVANYVKRVTVTLDVQDDYISSSDAEYHDANLVRFGVETTFACNVSYGVGTVQGEFALGAQATVGLTEEFKTALKEKSGCTDEDITTKSASVSEYNGKYAFSFTSPEPPVSSEYKADFKRTILENQNIEHVTLSVPYTYTYDSETLADGTATTRAYCYSGDFYIEAEGIELDESTIWF